jgi:hypothetical protein
MQMGHVGVPAPSDIDLDRCGQEAGGIADGDADAPVSDVEREQAAGVGRKL